MSRVWRTGGGEAIARTARDSSDAGALPRQLYGAIIAGVRAGDAARARFERSGVLALFVERITPGEAAPRLVALRTYAELRRALSPLGFNITGASLAGAGFSPTQIARFDALIADAPKDTALQPPGSTSPTLRGLAA